MEMGQEADAAVCSAGRGQQARPLPSLQWAWGQHQALRRAGPAALGCSWVAPAPSTSLPLPPHRAQLSPCPDVPQPGPAPGPRTAPSPRPAGTRVQKHLVLPTGRVPGWVSHSLSCLFTPWPLCHETWARPGGAQM